MAGPGIVVGIAGDTTGLNAALNSASTTVGGFGNRLTGVANSKGFQSVAQGVGMGVGISAYGLLAKGISTVTDFLQDAARMAAEDEQSVALLTAALKANVPAWDGNMSAIDGYIASGQKLAFTDDDIRESLARLSAVTHDIGEAYKFLTVAEDLARFKHISLGEASQALINIDGGRYKALGALIGSTKEITSATQALAAVEKVAGGAAQAYAESGLGKMEAAQDRVKESQERLGKSLVPLQVAWNDFVASGIDGWFMLGDAAGRWASESHPALVQAEKDLYANADAMGITAGATTGAGQSVLDFRDKVRYADSAIKIFVPGMGSAASASINLATEWKKSAAAADILRGMTNRVIDSLSIFYKMGSDKASHVILQNQLDKDTAAQKWLTKAFSDGKISADEVKTAQEKYGVELVKGSTHLGTNRVAQAKLTVAIDEDKTALLENAKEQAKLGNSAPLKAWLAAEMKRWQLLTLAEKQALAALYDFYHAEKNPPTRPGMQPRAAGGPVTAGQPYIVGEHHPEVFVPTENGTIIPSAPSFARGGAGAVSGPSGLTLNVYGNVYGPGGEDELADRISQRLRLVGSTR